MSSTNAQHQPAPATLPQTGLVRLAVVLQLIPVSESTWKRGIKEGRFPQPVKLGKKCLAWRAEDIRKLLLSAPEQASGATAANQPSV